MTMRPAALALMLLVLAPRPASADAVDDAIQELRNGRAKERLASGIELTKGGDARAIAALADALLHDRDKRVRKIAAAGLGEIVTAASSAADQQLAIAALGTASTQDPDARVRSRAARALDKVQLLVAGPVYVDLGSMTAHVGQVVGNLVAAEPGLQTANPATGFHLDATVTSVTPGQGALSCKVEVVLSSYPAMAALAVVTGSASVVGSGNATDCVDAVLENLLVKKVFPQIVP